jgi:hypothetical protein
MIRNARPVLRRWVLGVGLLAVFTSLGAGTATQEGRFFADDPIASDPETEDASGTASRQTDLLYEFIESLFMDRGRSLGPALNVNTIDEVPDSSWFTNRIGARALTAEEIARGPDTSNGPRPGTWTVERGKTDGVMPGLRILDSAGVRYFVKFDSPGFRELATGAEVVVTKLFHAIGYHVPENYITYINREDLVVGEGARKEYGDGRRRPLERKDLDLVLRRAAREPDGSYRVVASKALDGTPIGGFRFHGTRPDDPNDVVPHEARRELRGMRVFAAWVNHVDCKGSNTLDTVVPGPAGGAVRHHLLDFGSTLGSAGVMAREAWEGSEFIFDGPQTLDGMIDFGLPTRPWMHARYPDLEAVGRFEAAAFHPESWKPRLPNPAFVRARPEDLFWAARVVAAFTDEQIRAAVESGRYSNPRTTAYLVETLITRRDKISRAWLNVVNPLVDVELDATGVLTFDNAAVRAGVASEPEGYRADWFRYDNATGAVVGLAAGSTASSRRLVSPSDLPRRPGELVRVDVSAIEPPHSAWADPVRTYFRRTADGWRLVGLERSTP